MRATARLRGAALALLTAAGSGILPGSAGAQEVTLGTYDCKAERAVAIREHEQGPPVSGAIDPVAPTFGLVLSPADPADGFMSCLAATSADSDAVVDFCHDTDAPFFQATLKGREEPAFNSFFTGDSRIRTGGRVLFRNGPSSLDFHPSRGVFRYTLFYSEPQIFAKGMAFDAVTEQGTCRKAD